MCLVRFFFHSQRKAIETMVQTYQSAEIVPHFGDVRVEADGTRVGIQGITILVDLVVQHTN